MVLSGSKRVQDFVQLKFIAQRQTIESVGLKTHRDRADRAAVKNQCLEENNLEEKTVSVSGEISR